MFLFLDRQKHILYISHQGGYSFLPASKAGRTFSLVGGQDPPIYERSMSLGHLSCSTDMLSRGGTVLMENGACILRRSRKIRACLGKLFASEENVHFLLFFSLMSDPPRKGMCYEGDVSSQRSTYMPFPFKIMVLLVAPNWPNQPWFPKLVKHLFAPLLPVLLSKDLLSQALGATWHPRPEL